MKRNGVGLASYLIMIIFSTPASSAALTLRVAMRVHYVGNFQLQLSHSKNSA